MADLQTSFVGNATRTLDILHQLMFLWVALILITAFIPSNATLKLPLLDLAVPGGSTRLVCAVILFFMPLFAIALVEHVRTLCARLDAAGARLSVLTYPSVATFGAPWLRALLGWCFAFLQYIVALQMTVAINPRLSSGAYLGISFFLCSPGFFLVQKLHSWQTAIDEDTTES